MATAHWNGPGMYGHGMNGWGYVFMTVNSLILIALIAALAIAIIRWTGRPVRQEGGPLSRPEPQDLLAERFARGEIDESEFRRSAAALRQAGAPPGKGPTGLGQGPSAP